MQENVLINAIVDGFKPQLFLILVFSVQINTLINVLQEIQQIQLNVTYHIIYTVVNAKLAQQVNMSMVYIAWIAILDVLLVQELLQIVPLVKKVSLFKEINVKNHAT
jgi:hypothetical protein